VVYNDILYVNERGYVTLINIEEGIIENTGFLNDLVIDENGDVYITLINRNTRP